MMIPPSHGLRTKGDGQEVGDKCSVACLRPVISYGLDISPTKWQPGLQPREIRQIKAGAKGTEILAPCHSAASSARAQLAC